MIWVGGGIIVHGLETYHVAAPAHIIHAAALATANAVPVAHGFVEWLVSATGSGIVGLAIGGALIPLVGHVLAPAWKAVKAAMPKPGVTVNSVFNCQTALRHSGAPIQLGLPSWIVSMSKSLQPTRSSRARNPYPL